MAASEDVGNADPRALEVAVAAGRAVEFVGPARGADHPGPGHDLHRARAQVERVLPGDRRGAGARGARGRARPPLALRDSSVANARGLGHGEGYALSARPPRRGARRVADARGAGGTCPSTTPPTGARRASSRSACARLRARLTRRRAALLDRGEGPVDLFSGEHLAVLLVTALACLGSGLAARRAPEAAWVDLAGRGLAVVLVVNEIVFYVVLALRPGPLRPHRPAPGADQRRDHRGGDRALAAEPAGVRAHVLLGVQRDRAGAPDPGPAPRLPRLPLVVVRDRPRGGDGGRGVPRLGPAAHAAAGRGRAGLRVERGGGRRSPRSGRWPPAATTCSCAILRGRTACST